MKKFVCDHSFMCLLMLSVFIAALQKHILALEAGIEKRYRNKEELLM